MAAISRWRSQTFLYRSSERKCLMSDRGVSGSAGAHTLEMEVSNTGFMLDRLGQDCSPLQFLRELTQNSIEAMQQLSDKSGEIIWDVDWNRYDLTGTYKLACIDNGIGMTGEEMLEYINKLSSSMYLQAFDANFGVGAKIAAATRNHAGMIYLSWKDGVGYMTHLWRDPLTGKYGLQQLQRPDGSFGHWARVDDSIKPASIQDHGTMVILLGNDPDADTMKAPKEAASPSRWVTRYLNTRYFRFPEGTTVRARQGWEYPRSNTDTNLLTTVTGQEAYLDAHMESSGTVPLIGASARWWILKDEPALSQNSGHIASSGHISALYKDELYEMLTARAGTARLQLFGVIFGYNRVVIYVEPDSDPRMTPNTARTALLLDNEPLPWADWAAEFREKFPDELQALMDAVTAGSSSTDHRQAIRERLRQIKDLIKLSRYRRTPLGAETVDDTTAGGKSRETDSPTNGKGRAGSTGGRAGDIYALFLATDGDPAEEVLADTTPEVVWISASDGTRTPPFLEDRAAKYLPEKNLLQINADFRVVTDMEARWCNFYSEVGGAAAVISDVVHEWFEQALIETVLGVQALHGSQEWTLKDIANALSEEALTSATMQRYHVDVAVKRALGAKLGTLKDRSAA
jgi:hypothetical protein